MPGEILLKYNFINCCALRWRAKGQNLISNTRCCKAAAKYYLNTSSGFYLPNPNPKPFDSHPNRRASLRGSVSQPQLGYATNGNGGHEPGGGANVTGGATVATGSCISAGSAVADGGPSRKNLTTIQTHSGGGGGGCGTGCGNSCGNGNENQQQVTTTRRHKLLPFKLSFNRVATPTLNLR